MKLILRFLIIMLAMSLLGMVLVTTVSSMMSKKAILKEGYSKLQASVANGATYTDGWLKGQLALVNTLAVDLSEQPDLDPSRLLPVVQMHTNANADVFDVYFGVPSGIVTFSSGFQPPYEQGWASYKRPWYISAMKDVNKAVFTDLYVDVQTGDLCLTAAKAVIKSGDVVGVASSDMLIDQIKRNVAMLHVEDSEFNFITDRNGGILILSNDPSYVGDGEGNFDHLDTIDGGKYAGVWQKTANGGITEIIDANGEKKLFVCSVIDTTEWRLYSVVPYSSLLTTFNTLNATLIVISVIVLIIAATVAAVMFIQMKRSFAQAKEPGLSSRMNAVVTEVPGSEQAEKKAKTPRREDPLRRKDSPSQREETQSKHEEERSRHEEARSKHEEVRSWHEEAQPRHEEERSRYEEAQLRNEEAQSRQEEVQSRHEEAQFQRTETQSPSEKASFKQEPLQRERGPLRPEETVSESPEAARQEKHRLRNEIPEQVERNYKLSSLINNVINILRTRVLTPQIRFALNVDCAIPENLFGDDSRIRQILLMAVINSVKYTQRGNVYLSIQGKKRDQKTVVLKLVIMDTGRGMPQKDLTVLQSLVRTMNGEILAEADSGTDSVLTVSIPQTGTATDPLAVVGNPQGKSVLVYERRELYALSIMFALENLGVKCLRVADGAELAEKLAQNRFSYVFVAAKLFEEIKNNPLIQRTRARIVLLSETGEEKRDQGLEILLMPVYSLPIANVLQDAPLSNAVIPVVSSVPVGKEEAKSAADADKENLKAGLYTLKAAFSDLDLGTVYESLHNLRDYTKVEYVGSDVERVLHNTSVGDYDVAEALIDALLKKIE